NITTKSITPHPLLAFLPDVSPSTAKWRLQCLASDQKTTPRSLTSEDATSQLKEE
ncbi:hypothetical protein L9F63_016287, partial [Diploptera punctata]